MPQETFYQHQGMPFVVCRFTRRSPQLFKPHLHETVCIGAVHEGVVGFTIDGQQKSLGPGELALVNPETLHSCNAIAPEARSYSMLYLDVSWCLAVQQTLWQVAEFIPFNCVTLAETQLYEQYRQVVAQLFAPDLHLAEKEQELVELVTAVFVKGSDPQRQAESISPDIGLLKQVLREDLGKDLTLDSLASLLSANPYTLLRRFRQETGVTPHAYRMNCRIEQAKKYLQEGRDISETAFLCGFFDQSHFHRHFKAMTTVTPQVYRVNFVQ